MWDLGPAISEPRGRVRAKGWRCKEQSGCRQVPELRIWWQRPPRGKVRPGWGLCLAVSSLTDARQLQLAAAPHVSGQGLKEWGARWGPRIAEKIIKGQSDGDVYSAPTSQPRAKQLLSEILTRLGNGLRVSASLSVRWR